MRAIIFRLFIFLIVIGSLSACGFQLRGSSQIAEKYNPLSVQHDQLTQQQWQQLKSALQRASVNLTDKPEANRLRVSITRNKDSKLTNSSTSSFELRRLSMRLQFSVLDATGNLLLQAQEIRQNRTVELDTENVLSHDETIARAVRELERGLIRSMIYRLRQ